jgi:hypothetical protein
VGVGVASFVWKWRALMRLMRTQVSAGAALILLAVRRFC